MKPTLVSKDDLQNQAERSKKVVCPSFFFTKILQKSEIFLK